MGLLVALVSPVSLAPLPNQSQASTLQNPAPHKGVGFFLGGSASGPSVTLRAWARAGDGLGMGVGAARRLMGSRGWVVV